jgi:XTP/dITP diphosphohydrolase
MNAELDPKAAAFLRLLTIMDELRAGCPWDREQTKESIRHLTLEESFELSEAILSNDYNEIRKELGDVLLHIVFYAKMADELSHFNITDVINGLCEKLIHRHPHIYADTQVSNSDEVKENWEQLKLQEKGAKRVLEGVPKGLPALLKAIRIQDKARSVGFDWDQTEQVFDKVQEEIGELHEVIRNAGKKEDIEDELGDVLFSLVNYARFIGINPEDALEKTNRKFIYRFNYIEEKVNASGKKMGEVPLAEMELLWQEAKKSNK